MPRLADVITPTDKEMEEFIEEWRKKNKDHSLKKSVHFFDKLKQIVSNLSGGKENV